MIVLTGGAGFIGSNFLEFLNAKGITDILIVDSIKESSKWKLLLGKKYLDYVDKGGLFDYLNNLENSGTLDVEAIVHLGACSNTTETDFDYLLRNNYEYSKNLFHFSVKHSIPFIYASSAATYGSGIQGFDDNLEPSVLIPLNQYGYLKNLFDNYTMNFNYVNQIVGLKFFNVYGPGEQYKEEMASVIFKKYRELKNGECPKLFKSNSPSVLDGEQSRDFVYIEDVCKVLYFFLKNSAPSGIFNVGTGCSETFNAVVFNLMKQMKIERNVEYIEFPNNLSKQYQEFTIADVRKLRNIGYKEDFLTIGEGIRKYVEYLDKKEENPGYL